MLLTSKRLPVQNQRKPLLTVWNQDNSRNFKEICIFQQLGIWKKANTPKWKLQLHQNLDSACEVKTQNPPAQDQLKLRKHGTINALLLGAKSIVTF